MENKQKAHYVVDTGVFTVVTLSATEPQIYGKPYKSRAYAHRVAERLNFQRDYPVLYAEEKAHDKMLAKLTAKFMREVRHA